MPSICILGTGLVDDRDSCYGQACQLPDGDLLCTVSVGGGPSMHGGTELARSKDGGQTWQFETTILPSTQNPRSTNALKPTVSRDGKTVYAFGARVFREDGEKFGGAGQRDAVIAHSQDAGQTWSAAKKVPMSDWPLEVSHGALPLASGRLIAAASTMPSKERLGEQVVLAISEDGGQTWPRHSVVMQDPHGQHGYLEQKLAEFTGRVMATAWTVTLGEVRDQPNSFAISNDGGLTWGPIRSTGLEGQTMTPLPLGGDRLLVVYNRRHGHQGIVMSLVTFTDDAWTIHHESLLYDAEAAQTKSNAERKGVGSFDAFHFGFPIPLRLQDGTVLVTHWCRENGKAVVRWVKLRIDW